MPLEEKLNERGKALLAWLSNKFKSDEKPVEDTMYVCEDCGFEYDYSITKTCPDCGCKYQEAH